jgi:hypothetical protein
MDLSTLLGYGGCGWIVLCQVGKIVLEIGAAGGIAGTGENDVAIQLRLICSTSVV